jgi:hypothetical protein
VKKTRIAMIAVGGLLLVNGSIASAANLVVCGTPILAPLAAFACGAGANTLTGNAEEVVVDSYYDHIVLTNLVASGVGNAPTGNTHPSFDGQGVLIASFDGALIAPLSSLGGESFMNDTHANNFTGIDAIATWNAPGAGLFLFPVVGFNEQNGFYEGSTVLSGVLSWNVPAGESMIFPGSANFIAEVPEPATWALMLLGFAGFVFAEYRGRRSHLPRAA